MREMVCIKKGPWRTIEGPCINMFFSIGPFYNEIVQVSQSPFYDDCYIVKGYETGPNGNVRNLMKDRFAPLMDISDLEEVLNHQTESV